MTDLGPCCICGKRKADVTTIVMLKERGPTPGKGWGCGVCGLNLDGAIAVLCDVCAYAYFGGDKKLKMVCAGYPADGGRTPFRELPHVFFDHDMTKHEAEERLQ